MEQLHYLFSMARPITYKNKKKFALYCNVVIDVDGSILPNPRSSNDPINRFK